MFNRHINRDRWKTLKCCPDLEVWGRRGHHDKHVIERPWRKVELEMGWRWQVREGLGGCDGNGR